MKRLFLPGKAVAIWLVLFLAFHSVTWGQTASQYTFSANSGFYSAITGTPVTVNGNADDGYYNNIPMGFSFSFGGSSYSFINVSSNGWCTLAATSGGNNITNSQYTNSFTAIGASPTIAPLWDDVALSAANGISYLTTGTAGNYVTTVQWSNVLWNYRVGTTVVAFQVKFYQDGNKIQFVYNSLSGIASNASASVGIATSAGTWLSLNSLGTNPTASSSTNTINISSKPATNQTYTFTPPPTIIQSSPLQIATGNIYQGRTNAHLSSFQAAVANTNATLNSFSFTSAGNCTTTDLVNFKLYYNTSNTFPGSSALASITSTGAGAHTFTGLSQVINSGTIGYFWITCDVNPAAIVGRTVNIAANPTLTFISGTLTGSIDIGGTQTITAGPGSNVKVTYSSAGNFSWAVPSCVTSVTVEAWGGGGAGGGTNNINRTTGGGGGGGTYTKATNVAVSSGTIYVTVGAGGIGAPNAIGGNGGTSTFNSVSPVSAVGGYGGGIGNGNPLNGAGATIRTGVTFNGGAGGTGNANTSVSGTSGGGGGGSGSGSSGNAINPGIAGGSGGIIGTGSSAGGTGAVGKNKSGNGIAANGLAAGGSGGRNANRRAASRTGGAGATGMIVITYTLPSVPTITGLTNPTICYGSTTANLTYSSYSGCPDKYSIVYNAAANAAGFANVTDATFTSSPIVINIGGTAVAGSTYHGTITLRNSAYGFESAGYPIAVTINSLPAIPNITSNNFKTYTGIANVTAISATPGAGETIDWYDALSLGTKVASGSATYTPIATNAGTYTFYAEARNTTYGCVSEGRKAVSLTISAASLTYSANAASKTYGDANPLFGGTITGFLGTDNQANATTGTLAFSSPTTTISAVGNYAILGSGLTANNGNYTFAQAAGNSTALTITQRPLNLTGSRAYDGTETFLASQLISGNIVNPDAVILSGTATVSSKNVNTYTSFASNSLSSSNTNYKVIGGTVNVSITTAASTTWTGASGTNWNTSGNWSPVVPGPGISVTIPSVTNKPVIGTSGNQCADLTLAAGAALTIAYNGNLMVNGTLNNTGVSTDLLIQSTSSGTGSLITKGNIIGIATVERYISGASWSWHFLSSPVSGQGISGGFTPSGTGNGFDFYTWYEPTLTWVNFKNTTTAPTWNTANGSANFIPGRGYLVAYEATNTTKSFVGLLNTGAVSYPLTHGGNSTYQYFNLVGNPYPCSIDWDASSGWGRNNLDGSQKSYWVWNDAAGNYGAYINGSFGFGTNGVTNNIAGGQGFIVLAAAPGNFTMNDLVKVHNAQPYLKSEKNINEELRIKLTCDVNTYSDESIVAFNGSDPESGSEKFNSMFIDAPELWSVKNGNNYSINYMGDVSADKIVPLTVKAGVAGNYTITASQVESFSGNSAISLEDRSAGTYTFLSASPSYTFQVNSPTTITGRFFLHFMNVTGIANTKAAQDFTMYAADGIIHIQSMKQQSGKIAIYDMLGRTIATGRVEADAITQINMNGKTGVYIVSVFTPKGISSTKIMVK